MAGPATNVATIGAVKSALGQRITSIYLGTVLFGSLLLGTLFDGVLSSNIQMGHAHEHQAWWAQISAVILLLLLGHFIIEEFRMSTQPVSNSDTMQIIQVEGMTCNGCVNRLQKVLSRVDGVTEAIVTLEPGEAKVEGTVTRAIIVAAIEGAGFDVIEAD
jgi:hypothetical protein